MADFQADVPERVEQPIQDLGKIRQGLEAGGDLPVVQEHEIDVAARVQFGPAVAADGHQGYGRKLLLCLLGQTSFGRLPQVAQE